MNKSDLLTLLESEKKSLLKSVSDKNKNNVIGIFEAAGILKRDSATPVQKKSEPLEPKSSRPDFVEMDAKSNGGVYDVSPRKTNEQPMISKKQESSQQETKKTSKKPADAKPNTTDKDVVNDNKDTKEHIKEPETNTTENEDASNNSKVIDMNSGYPEIQLTEELKGIDEKDLGDTISKTDLDAIMNAGNDAKSDVYRNLLLIKKDDVGGSDKYDCFTTGKGGTKFTKGEVPSKYIEKYYTQLDEKTRTDTGDVYIIFGSKLKGNEEKNQVTTLPSDSEKYIIYTNNPSDGSEYITILTQSEFDVLFHMVRE